MKFLHGACISIDGAISNRLLDPSKQVKPPVYHRMFGYNLSLLPNTQLAMLEEGVTTIEQARQKSGATIGYPGWGLIHYRLLSHLDRSRNEFIIETGTNWGCTTLVLAQALIDAGCRGRVITFELDPANAQRVQVNLKAGGVAEHVEVHVGDSRALLPKALVNKSPIRVAFLDASRLYENIKQKFETLLPILADDALVIFNNTYRIAEDGEDQRVNGFLRHMQGLYGGTLINMEFVSWYTPRLAIWRRQRRL